MAEVKFLGKMPNPFVKEDGTMVSKEEWKTYKYELLEKIVDIEYGGMPPKPEIVEIERLSMPSRGIVPNCFRIHAGKKEKKLTFILEIYVPIPKGKSKYSPLAEGEKYPVLLTGDGCWQNMNSQVIEEAMKRGYITAKFNRLEVANDVRGSQEGGIYDIYPNMDFTDISAWAWPYMVCMDVFEKLSFTDEKEVGITGHSRGGKVVMLAAAVDERIKYVCINNSGCHGAASHRCVVTNQGEIKKEAERISDMFKNFPTWMGKKLEAYVDNEQNLPYDMHYFGAMIAPRFYLQNEGMQDYWGNPISAWQNFMAVKKCYEYLGCENNLGAWFRPGGHHHQFSAFTTFLDFMDRARNGLGVAEHLKINPYPEIEKNFDW